MNCLLCEYICCFFFYFFLWSCSRPVVYPLVRSIRSCVICLCVRRMVFLDYRKFSVVCSCSLSVYSFWCWWCNTAPTHSTRTHCICRLLYTKIQYNIIKGYAQRSCHYYCVWYCGTCRRGLNSFTCDPVSTLRLLIIMDFLLFFFCLVVCVAIATADHITSHGNKSDARCLRAFVSRSVVRFGGHLWCYAAHRMTSMWKT